MAGLSSAIALVALLFLSTGTAQAAPNVVASIKPVHALVSAVMLGVGEPHLIVSGSASPHDFSLRPSNARALQEADVIFWIGPELEVFLAGPLSGLAADSLSVELAKTDGLSLLALREGGSFEQDEDEIDRHQTDMHVWLDPFNAGVMVARIADTLAVADPGNASVYRANAELVSGQLDQLTTEVTAQLQPVAGKPFVVFHDAFHYFESRFGLAAAGSITVSSEAVPGVRRIAEIHDKLRSLEAACVFSEPQFEPSLVLVVIEGTNAKTGVLDPLGAGIEDGAMLYFALIRNMADSMLACLTTQG